MHVLIDASDMMPDYVHITEGCKHDLVMKWLLNIAEGTIVVFNRGYNDHGFYDKLTYRRVKYVTRMRSNTIYEVIKNKDIPYNIKHIILSDQIIRITVPDGILRSSSARSNRIFISVPSWVPARTPSRLRFGQH